jgi:hypothetical protein
MRVRASHSKIGEEARRMFSNVLEGSGIRSRAEEELWGQ